MFEGTSPRVELAGIRSCMKAARVSRTKGAWFGILRPQRGSLSSAEGGE